MLTRRSRQRPLLLVWIPAINPYWADRLKLLSLREDITLICWFTRTRGKGREWLIPPSQLAFPHIVLPEGKFRRLAYILYSLGHLRPSHLLTFHFDPLHWWALPLRIFGCKTSLYVEKMFDPLVPASRLKELAKHIVLRSASTIFVPGTDARQYARQYAPNARFRRLDHVVDTTFLGEARTLRMPCDWVRFLYLGHLVPQKGVLTLIQAFEAASQQADMSLTIVGSGELKADISSWRDLSGLRVTISPFVQARDLQPVFAKSDVLIFPTKGDTYGLVVNEALASGMPVVSSDAAGEIVDRLTAGPSAARGVVLPSGSEAALCEALVRFAQDRDLLREMSDAASAYAKENFDPSLWVESVMAWSWSRPGRPI